MIPGVNISKVDGQTGTVRPGTDGVLAILAASSAGTVNQPTAYTQAGNVSADFGFGPLPECSAYALPITGNPIVACKSNATTVGAYGTVTKTGAGTASPSAGATHPYDDFDVVIVFPVGGALGTAGITYQTSLDGGKTFGPETALGTALTIAIPNTGVEFTLGTSTQTILAGEQLECVTTRPMPTNTDLPAALEAFRTTSQRFECLLIDMAADDSTVTLVAAWLLTLNALGRYPTVILTARPRGATESEADYATAMATMFASSVCDDIVVCADRGDVTSTIRGILQPRPVGLGLAARAMKIPLGEDPAYVNSGPIAGFKIKDTRGGAKYHDEVLFPGLDDLRLAVLRSIEGEEGAFINNANLLSQAGSDYVYLQHARCINRACERTFQILTRQLSRGVAKNPKPGPNGARYIAEFEAQHLEALVQDVIDRELVTPRQVDDLRFTIARDDDLSSNGPATVTCQLQSVALAYVKKFRVTAGFVKQIGS